MTAATRRSAPPLARLALGLTSTLLVALAFGACVEPATIERHEGGSGYACYFDEDCAAPLICEETLAAQFPVCTGTALLGEPCGAEVACAWVRDEQGLPLSCVSGVCEWPE